MASVQAPSRLGFGQSDPRSSSLVGVAGEWVCRCNGTPWLITPKAIAERMNAYLGEGWPAPPHSGDQVATLALCLEMAREA